MDSARFAGLEVLTPALGAKVPREIHETPLLFLHGAYLGAWCWAEYFLPYFAAQGYVCYALSFSGHGASKGREHLDSFGINDYVDDVVRVVTALPAPPVLIGHSMGGFVVQKYLEQHRLQGAVLMSSVPPQGLMASAFGMMFEKPRLLADLNRLMSGGRVGADTLRQALFAQPIEAEALNRYLHLSQRESHRAIWDMTLFNLPHPSRVKDTPLLVLGAEFDQLIPESLVEMTARSYSVKAEILPRLGHGMMLERDWETVAGRIVARLDEWGI